MEEVEFLRGGTILVTSTRIEIAGQTFAVRNVGSVKVTQPKTPLITTLFACGFVIFGAVSPAERFIALITGAGLLLYAIQQVRTRRLVLISDGGQSTALTSTDKATVEKIRAAIAQAISAR